MALRAAVHHVPSNMVDIHSHILHGLDDGSKTLEESVAMVRLAAESGTTDIVASPHSNIEYAYQPELVERKIAELRKASGSVLRIHRGCDFHLSYENIQQALAEPGRFTINGRRYLLVEFSDLMILNSAGEVFKRMRAAGMTPVITHPERNLLLVRGIEDVREWVEAGCYVQLTAHSFLGRFGKKARAAAERFLESGLAHFVASDAHDTKHRPPTMAEAYRHVEAKYGERAAEVLFITNPRAALEGEAVEAPEVVKRGWNWRRWW